jgi:hypothetical protein
MGIITRTRTAVVGNPATRPVTGPGMEGAHIFRCATCPNGVVVYDARGNRRDHILRVPAKEGHVAFSVHTYCNRGRSWKGFPVTGRDYPLVFRAAVRFAAC